MPARVRLEWALLPLCTGCLFNPFACITQARSLDATGALLDADSAHSGSVTLSFLQLEGGDNQSSLSWFVRGAVDTARVTAVHIHRGHAGEVGDVVFAFPGGYSGPGDVITQSGPQLWSGTMDYDELFRHMREGGIHVDVHTVDEPDGALRGQLSVTLEGDWHDACT